jgi:hypothetical protein
MAVHPVSGEARFASTPFSNRWSLWAHREQLAEMHRRPRHRISEVVLADGTELTLEPRRWGVVAAVSQGREWGHVIRRSWWGRRWDLTSPTFAYALTSDPLPRRWTIRVGNEPIGKLAGGLVSYNHLTVRTDVAVQVLPLVMAWHVLARPWEAAAAPLSLIPAAAGTRPAT